MFALNFSSSLPSLFMPKRPNLISAVFLWFATTQFSSCAFFMHCRRRYERWEQKGIRQTRKLWSNLEWVCVCVCNWKGISFLMFIKSEKRKYFHWWNMFREVQVMLMKHKLAADVIHILPGYLKRFHCICHVLRERVSFDLRYALKFH